MKRVSDINCCPDCRGDAINDLAKICHANNKRWYTDPATGEPVGANVAEKLALIHSEISEALEGHRKNLPDTHLPHRPMVEVELADAIIRIFDLAAYLELDLGGAYVEKINYNVLRADHTNEARLAPGGKKY